jgi:hypothetical protein
VNAEDVVQLGIALQFENDGDRNVQHIFEINLKVDPKLHQYNPSTCFYSCLAHVPLNL